MDTDRKNYNISKIFPFEFAADLLINNELFFSRPSSWDDPFEKLNDTLDNKMVFAQCWCKTSYSDAMWRIFSQNRGLKNNGPGIQIRTTSDDWTNVLKNSISDKNIKLLQGNVEYVRIKEYEKSMMEDKNKLIFKKRNAFKHELEYRFVILVEKDTYKHFKYNNGMKIPLVGNIKDIINKVIWIDPFASPFFTEAIADFFIKHGFKSKQSKIYSEPEEKFRHI